MAGKNAFRIFPVFEIVEWFLFCFVRILISVYKDIRGVSLLVVAWE